RQPGGDGAHSALGWGRLPGAPSERPAKNSAPLAPAGLFFSSASNREGQTGLLDWRAPQAPRSSPGSRSPPSRQGPLPAAPGPAPAGLFLSDKSHGPATRLGFAQRRRGSHQPTASLRV